jgi:hypothetical protein
MALGIAGLTNEYRSRFLDLRGGLNNSKSDEFIEINELSKIRNLLPDVQKSGGLVKRDGLAKKSSQMSEALSSVFDGQLADYFTTLTTVRSLGGSSLDSGLTSATAVDWASFDDKNLGMQDVMVNGTEERRTSNGTSFSAVGGTPPNFKYISDYQRFLFGAGHDAGHLRWCEAENLASWPTANEIIVNDSISGLIWFGRSLIMFCDSSFHHITGSDENGMTISYSNTEVGCASFRSIVVTPLGLFWWSNRGMMWSPDGFKVHNPTLSKIPQTFKSLDEQYFNRVHGVFNPRLNCVSMWVTTDNSSTEDMRIDYFPEEVNALLSGPQAQYGSFWVQGGDGASMSASGIITESGEDKTYVAGTGSASYLYTQTGEDDDGTSITAYFETKRETAELGEDVVKRIKNIELLFILSGATSLSYGIYVDDGMDIEQSWDFTVTPISGFILDSDVLGTGVLGPDAGPGKQKLGYSRKWTKIKHRFFDSSASQTRFRGLINTGKVIHG